MAASSTKITASGAVPIKPHLLAFILKKENLKPGTPLLLPGDSVLSNHLFSLLCTKAALRDDRRHFIPIEYTDNLLFRLEDHAADRGKIFITPTRIQSFNQFVHRLMHEFLFAEILRGQEEGREEKECIYRFINYYGLFDLNFDALKKASLRYRERKEFPLFRQKKTAKIPEFHWRNCPPIAHPAFALASA